MIIEGKDALNKWREITGSTFVPGYTLRWHAASTLNGDYRLSKEYQTITGLCHERMLVVSNGVHGPKDNEELDKLAKAFAPFVKASLPTSRTTY